MSIKKITFYLTEDTTVDDLLDALKQKFSTQVDASVEPPIAFIQKKYNQKVILKNKEELVITYLKEGLTYNQIAEKTGISVDGVRFYIKRIYQKLGVNNAREALHKYFG